MKKNKGFTLIELLAVIVVLAIIALIATPIVMNTIKNAKKGAAERSGESYVKQVETAIMEYRMESGNTLPDGTYDINEDGNLTGNGLNTPLTIEMSGTKPNNGTIVIENGQVSTTGTSMNFGDYTVSYDSTKKTYVATEKNENNVEVLCTANTAKASALVYNSGDANQASSYNSEEVGLLASESGNYTAGVTYTCNVGDGKRTFYVLAESGDNVSLILGTNLGSTVAWSSDGSNANGPVTAKAYLEEQTSEWTKLNSSQISFPTGDQIYIAAGQPFGEDNIVSGLPTWLYGYTDANISYGYWTLTPYESPFRNLPLKIKGFYFAWSCFWSCLFNK